MDILHHWIYSYLLFLKPLHNCVPILITLTFNVVCSFGNAICGKVPLEWNIKEWNNTKSKFVQRDFFKIFQKWLFVAFLGEQLFSNHTSWFRSVDIQFILRIKFKFFLQFVFYCLFNFCFRLHFFKNFLLESFFQ